MKNQDKKSKNKQYLVFIDNVLVKIYEYKLQAYTYLMIKGFIYHGKGNYFINKKAKIIKTTIIKEKM